MSAPTPRLLAVALCGALSLTLSLAGAAGAAPKQPFDEETARRYKEILERDPGGEAVYRHLVEHYGKGPGLSALIRHYEAQVDGKGKGKGKGKEAFASQLLLGKLYRSAGRFEEAQTELAVAAELDPTSPLPLIASAEMARRRRAPDGARKLYEQGLKLTRNADARERILKVLAEMALDAHDAESAKGYLDRLKRERPGDRFLRADVARLYARFGAVEASLGEWRSILKSSKGNRREEVRSLKEIGALLSKLDRDDEAEKAYRRALSMVAAGNWNVQEIRERLVEIRRRQDRLRELLAEFERTWKRRRFEEWLMLAKLNEEVSREGKAIAAYRKAIALRRKDPGVRLGLIRLFERLGRIDEVVTEYKRLIASAPSETRYQVELADLLYRRQEPTRAIKMLDGIARKYGREPGVMESLADAYTRYGENDRALKAYQKLVRREPREESHLISLGEQYALMGDMVEARKAWRTVLKIVPDKAKGWHLLGETYSAHDLPNEAVDAFRKAALERPDDIRLLRSLALAHERMDDKAAAVQTWEKVHALAQDDHTRREARRWIVRLYRGLRRLPRKVHEWKKVFRRPDTLRKRLQDTEGDERKVVEAELVEAQRRGLEAGRMLAEGLMLLDKHVDAEKVLRRILEQETSDMDTLEALEELYLSRNELSRAIEVLTKIAEVNPYRAREYYQRVAEYSLREYHDEDAVRFAGLAVDINPDDSQAHARLAHIYYLMQDLDAAALEYRKAVDLDRLNFEACFELARVLRDLGRMAEADAQYRDVIKRAADDDHVLKAARKSLHLNLMSGGLEDLEREILPLLWRSPPRPVFRRIITELYGHLVWPLRNQARYGRGAEAKAARAKLDKIGERAVKPLLEALTDDDSGLRMAALEVLADLGHGDAAIPLGQLLDEREARVRMRAAVALGRIGDKRAIPALRRGLKDVDQGVRAVSAWALGSVGGAKATAALLSLFDAGAPEQKWKVRAVGAAALGRAGGRQAIGVLTDLISPETADSKEEVRGAAAWALGRLDPARAEAALLVSMEQDTLLVRRLAARALATRTGDRPTAALLTAVWTGETSLRAAALTSLSGEPLSDPDLPGLAPAFIDLDAGTPDAKRYVMDLAQSSTAATARGSAAARVALVLKRSPEIISDALAAALDSDESEVVRQVLRDLDRRTDGPALGPLTAGELAPGVQTRLADVLAAGAVRHTLETLATGDDPEVRGLCLSILGKVAASASSPSVGAAFDGVFDAALTDPEKEVRRATVEALGRGRSPRAEPLLRKALSDGAWSVRAEAVDALARRGGADATVLLSSALTDPFAYVRSAAARGLGQLRATPAKAALVRALVDRSAPVRAAAATALSKIGDADVIGSLKLLRSDRELLVREAAAAAIKELTP